MRKLKGTIVSLRRPLLFVIGGIMLVASNISMIFPFLVTDWRIAFVIGNTIFIIFAIWTVYDLSKKYVDWSKPKINLVPKPEDEQDKFYVSKHIYLYVYNDEERPITDCHATIEWAELWLDDGREVNFVERDYLKWAEKFSVSENITIPANDYRRLDVASTIEKGRLKFSTLSQRESSPQGLYSKVRIRIDGNFNSIPMKPDIFDGYLFVEKSQIEQHLESVNVIFSKGDWKKDFNIPIRRDVNLN